MADKITLHDALNTVFWMAICAGEPERKIEVEMTYAELFVIKTLIEKGIKQGKKEE